MRTHLQTNSRERLPAPAEKRFPVNSIVNREAFRRVSDRNVLLCFGRCYKWLMRSKDNFMRTSKLSFGFTIFITILMFSSSASAQQKFNHPGIFHSAEQLAVVKSKIEAGEEPWKSAYQEMKESSQSSLSYEPRARANVECGGHNRPNHGCDDITQDGRTAYTHALHWILTGKQAHADKAIEILNAWANVHKETTNKNAPLVIGWAGPHFINAAELLRYSDSGWTDSDIAAFEDYIRAVYIPVTDNRTPPTPNWLFSILEVRMAVAVFTEDEKLWNECLETWRHRIVTSIYQTSDGKEPVRFGDESDAFMRKWWYGAWQRGVWVDGISQETCRDMPHNQMGLKGMMTTAEIAWHQGVDLYGEEKKRLADYMEFHAKILMGDPTPMDLCTINKNSTRPTWEIGYNHLVNVKGMELPDSFRVIETIRPTISRRHMWAWETLTHADVGKYSSRLTPRPIASSTSSEGDATSAVGETINMAEDASVEEESESRAVWAEDFNSLTPGENWEGRSGLTVMKDGGVDNSQCLRVEYDIRQDPLGTTVRQFTKPVPPALEYTLQYDLYFEDNWSNSYGGKFHGFTPETHVTGCRPVQDHTWSARMVLRNRVPRLYLYDQKKTSRCGRTIGSDVRLQKGRWYSISYYLKVNSSADSSDGEARLYIDGELVSSASNMQFHAQDGDHTKINNFFFSTFLVRNSTGEVVSRQHMRYDNFAVLPGEVIRKSPGIN